jgi:hypothetical protein
VLESAGELFKSTDAGTLPQINYIRTSWGMGQGIGIIFLDEIGRVQGGMAMDGIIFLKPFLPPVDRVDSVIIIYHWLPSVKDLSSHWFQPLQFPPFLLLIWYNKNNLEYKMASSTKIESDITFR